MATKERSTRVTGIIASTASLRSDRFGSKAVKDNKQLSFTNASHVRDARAIE